MSKMYFLPFRPAFDSAGITVPGSQHYFTLAGTNTPSAPYTDATLTTRHENPLVSDGIGYLPPVYLDPAISYRIRVYGSTAEAGVDTPLEEYDPYVPALSYADVLATLAASDGSNFVAFDPTATYDPGTVGAELKGFHGTLVPSPNYVGVGGDSTAIVSQGSVATPSTTMGAPLVVQKTSNALTFNAFASFAYKYSSTSGARATAHFSEATDEVGGTDSFVEGKRSHAILRGGANGAAYGSISVAGTTATGPTTPKYLIGHEAEVDDQVGTDAPAFTSFDPTRYKAGYVATNGLGAGVRKKSDAAFAPNPFSLQPWRTGLLLPVGSIDHTGIAGGVGLSIVTAIDFSRATLSGAFLKGPNNVPNTARNAAGNADLIWSMVDNADVLQLGAGTNGVHVNGALGASGSITALGGLGYATGAGGVVSQLTSKSTGVTLNKLSGAITLHNAALASNTSVSFTLTNSQIAANDLVIVNIAAAATADAYVVTVTAVGSGSCRIQVRNVSGGSLSEAVVLNFAILKAVAA